MEGRMLSEGDERMDRYAKRVAEEMEERILKEARRKAPGEESNQAQQGTTQASGLPPITPVQEGGASGSSGMPGQGHDLTATAGTQQRPPQDSELGIKRNLVEENGPPAKQPRHDGSQAPRGEKRGIEGGNDRKSKRRDIGA
eukprot:13432608-Alexandrium_andersonii.AAC.1